ncbi:MAG: NUDIX hydrolase [Pseudomonadota bacterium]
MHGIPDHQHIQVAVIPFRVRQGQQEILLVTARKKQHWTLPKGDYNDDLSMQEIAKIKAFQEAGIKGNVSESCIGVYQYLKNATPYRVYVFVMEVHGILDQAYQKKRRRKWLPLHQAIGEIKQRDLRLMIRHLPEFLIEAELKELIGHLPIFTRFKS